MKRAAPAVVFIVSVMVMWEIIVVAFSVPEYLLPPPSSIVLRLLSNIYTLLPHLGITAFEAISGFLLGTIFGVTLAIGFVHFRTVEMGLYPYTIALKSVPIVAIAPLLVMWFGNGVLPKIIVAAIISFFPVVVNVTKGLRSLDAEAVDLFNSLYATPAQLFFKLRVPRALPFLFAALRFPQLWPQSARSWESLQEQTKVWVF